MTEKVSWYVSCSPRSPEKIQPELRVLTNFENCYWKGKKGHPAQEAFAKALAELPEFLGSTYKQEASFSARDRVAPMKTYGFVYVDKKGYLQITPAGQLLADNVRPKEIFLKQLAKWQYPSTQHKGKAYPTNTWSLHPFIFILKLLKRVDSLSKLDIAMFCLTVTNNNELNKTAEEILDFREELSKIKGENPRLEFIENYFYTKFSYIYIGVSKIREGKSNAKDPIAVKMQNARDVADATTRYFRYTGLFVARGNKLVLNPEKTDIIDELIATAKINPNYNDIEKFHNFFGNPSLPLLSFETKENLYKKAKSLYKENSNIIEVISESFPNAIIDSLLQNREFDSINKNSDLESLKNVIYTLQEIQLSLRVKNKQLDYQNPNNLEKIITLLEIYFEKNNVVIQKMKEHFLANKNTVLEWLVWNGFIALGNAEEYKNNFIIDEELSPVTHAAGNQADMEIYYDDFMILGEVTTSSGATQFKMEAEPVTRHVQKMMHFIETHSLKKEIVYCLFIAPELNDNTFEHFSKFNDTFDTKIIPFSLKQYIDLLHLQKQLLKRGTVIKKQQLKQLLDMLVNATTSNLNDFKLNKQAIQEAYDEWKTQF